MYAAFASILTTRAVLDVTEDIFGRRATPRGERLKVHHPRAVYCCPWAEGDPLLSSYHDEEWSLPERDSRKSGSR